MKDNSIQADTELPESSEKVIGPAEWLPIETATKDGTEILAFVDGFGMGQMVLYWADGYWREKANGMGLKKDPTHWMPLPSPPGVPMNFSKEAESTDVSLNSDTSLQDSTP